MPSQKNINAVQDLSDKLSRAKMVVLTDYSGLPVNLQRELRQKITAAGGQFVVAKNTLFKLALGEKTKQIPPDVEAVLRGPTAYLFAYEDEITPVKALVEFSKAHELPKSKLGILFKPQDRILSIDEINDLAQLPARNQLLTQLVASLNSPMSGLANVISGNLRKLVIILQAIKEKKASN